MQIRRRSSTRRSSYDQITMINLAPQPIHRRGSGNHGNPGMMLQGGGRIRRNGLSDISGALTDAEMRVLRRLQGNTRRRRSSHGAPETRGDATTEAPIESEGACAALLRRSSTTSLTETERAIIGDDHPATRPSRAEQCHANSNRRSAKTRRNAICYANATEMFLGAIKDKVAKAKDAGK